MGRPGVEYNFKITVLTEVWRLKEGIICRSPLFDHVQRATHVPRFLTFPTSSSGGNLRHFFEEHPRLPN